MALHPADVAANATDKERKRCVGILAKYRAEFEADMDDDPFSVMDISEVIELLKELENTLNGTD